MPRYTNSTSADITVGSYRIPANEYLDIDEFLLSLPSGITQSATTPILNNVILSGTHEGDSGTATVTIPTSVNSVAVVDYVIDIACVTGSVTVKFNDSSYSPAVELQAGEGFKTHTSSRQYASILLTYGTVGTAVKVDVIRSRSHEFYKFETPSGSLVPEDHDYIGLSYSGDNLVGVAYKTGGAAGTTVATLTLAYSGDVLTSVTRS